MTLTLTLTFTLVLNLNRQVERRVAAAEAEAASRIEEARAQQASNERKLAVALDSTRQAQAALDRSQAQVFDANELSQRRASALLADNATLVDDLQIAQNRIVKLEAEVTAFAAVASKVTGEQKTVGDGAAANTAVTPAEDDEKTLQAVVSDLQGRLRESEEGRRTDRLRAETSARDGAAALTREREALARCEQALAARPSVEDYAALRRQLRVLQRVAFNGGGDDGDDDDGADTSDPESTLGQVETMLANRVKSLESELVETRGGLSEARKELATAHGRVLTLESSVERYTKLNQRLETDLERQVES